MIQGYLTEPKLAAALRQLFPSEWVGMQFAAPGTKYRWDVAVRIDGITTVVDYDGDEHYRHSMKIKTDRAKDESARDAGFRVIRFPYWIQLDNLIVQHYFGITASVEQSFPHGFITTKLFPASFCEMGIARFESELFSLPAVVRDMVIKSLRERASEHGVLYVLPSGLAHLIG